MKFNLQALLQILPEAQCFNVSDDESFDIINIAHLAQFEFVPSTWKILYFCVYEDNPQKMDWYNSGFDRTLNIQEMRGDDRFVFLVDGRVQDERLVGARYIRVDNIYYAIDRIRNYVLSQVSPKVIGVTGSVGKTTSIALIQDVLETQFNCSRIYSKRLTPLTLSSWLVNFLDQSCQILVSEYSMYRKNHIDILTDLLRPDIGVFLNVKRVHLGVSGIDTLDDIVEGKAPLIMKSAVALLNVDDPLVARVKRKGDLGFSLVDSKADAFISTVGDEAILTMNYTNQVIRFVPYVRTSLFYYQASVAGLLGTYLGISPELIAEALKSFKPEENRINWADVFGHKVLFDGDVTNSGRILSLSEHHYSSSVLLLHNLDFGDGNVNLQTDDLNQAFCRFTEVRILDSEENRTIVSKYSLKNLTFVEKADFLLNLSGFEFKVLHFGTYFRKHKHISSLMQYI